MTAAIESEAPAKSKPPKPYTCVKGNGRKYRESM